MTHKIDGLDGRPVSVTGGAGVARPRDVGQENRADGKAGKASPSDIQITSAARQLAALEKLIAQIPVVDEARVKTISAAIADGRYQIDADKIAERVLRSDVELSEARRSER
jgi:negative regulator of flagellin synthesis FlgM